MWNCLLQGGLEAAWGLKAVTSKQVRDQREQEPGRAQKEETSPEV